MAKLSFFVGGGFKDSYLELVLRFPLRPLRSEKELDEAIKMIDSLLDRSTLNAGENDYLEVLSDLVEKYENEHHPIPQVVSDGEMLKHLIEAKGVTQAEVARETRIPESTISEVLSEKRKLNRNHIRKLSAYFHVSPAVFIIEG